MNFCQIYCIIWPVPSHGMDLVGHLNLTGQNFPVEHEHEMGGVETLIDKPGNKS